MLHKNIFGFCVRENNFRPPKTFTFQSLEPMNVFFTWQKGLGRCDKLRGGEIILGDWVGPVITSVLESGIGRLKRRLE